MCHCKHTKPNQMKCGLLCVKIVCRHRENHAFELKSMRPKILWNKCELLMQSIVVMMRKEISISRNRGRNEIQNTLSTTFTFFFSIGNSVQMRSTRSYGICTHSDACSTRCPGSSAMVPLRSVRKMRWQTKYLFFVQEQWQAIHIYSLKKKINWQILGNNISTSMRFKRIQSKR